MMKEQQLLEKFSRKSGQAGSEHYRELMEYKENCAKNRDIQGLADVYRFDVLTGAGITLVNDLPAFSYLCGRLHDRDTLTQTLNTIKQIHADLFFFSSFLTKPMEMAERLFSIGWRFPDLPNSDLDYLESLYCDRDFFETMDIIIFDIDLLSRPIKKLNKELFSKKNCVFSDELLDTVFRLLEKTNDDLEQRGIYDRFNNSIRFVSDYSFNNETVHRGENRVAWHERSAEFYSFLKDEYGEEVCSRFLNYFEEEHKEYISRFDKMDFAENTRVVFDLEEIVCALDKCFQTQEERVLLRRNIAKYWLSKKNK